MERRVIDIDITPETLDESLEENAGVMWEHNATMIVFHIDERYAGDYRYYIEYRSLIGTRVRTQNLVLDSSDNAIIFEIPVEMSSLMSVECFFNIVAVDSDGKTRQVIKPKKFCLDFEMSPDTDNAIAKENDFSVNALLEAIRNNAFKGEKGDKGDAYLLTDADRADIAGRINEDIYGLPFVRKFTAKGEMPLTGISENGQVRAMSLIAAATDLSEAREDHPVYPEAVNTVKIFIGKNEIEHLLKPEAYSNFSFIPEIAAGSYYTLPIYLKPNTKFITVRYSKTVNNCYSAIKAGDSMVYFAHKQPQYAKDYLEFTTDDTGLVYWTSTVVGTDEAAYKMLLEEDFRGLGIYEAEKSAIITVAPETPLYSLSPENCDYADAVTGDVEHNIEALEITEPVQISEGFGYNSGGKTVYRYLVDTIQTPDARLGYDVVSSHYKTLDRFINSDSDFAEVLAAGKDYVGVYLKREEGKIYIYSDKFPTELVTLMLEQNEAGTPIKIFYRMRYPVTESLEPRETVINSGYDKVRVFPESVTYDMHINGSISAALNYLLNVKGEEV